MRYPFEVGAVFFTLILGLGLSIVPFIIFYQIIKAAVRNGINESVLGRTQARHEPRP